VCQAGDRPSTLTSPTCRRLDAFNHSNTHRSSVNDRITSHWSAAEFDWNCIGVGTVADDVRLSPIM